jgi:1,4-alpha-glucan branching enzyme
MESSRQVWSSKEGYPGDPDYREFYRDVGYDLPESDLHPYLRPEGLRRFTGLKYYRVTGATEHKEPYDPERARRKAAEHAADFLERRREQARRASEWMDRTPLMTCLYDAELFGHWWYEGPDFLEALFERNAQEGTLRFLAPSDYLRTFPRSQTTQPVFSSWGLGGYSEFWLNGANDWIYPHLNHACREMTELASKVVPYTGSVKRALRQAARELLLAQASDWAFMMKAGHYAAYATTRVKTHLNRFHRLAEQVRRGKVEERFLADLEEKDNLFPSIRYEAWKPR